MVPIGHVLAFAAAVTALTVIPGPAVLFSRALTADRKSALCTVAGNELGAAGSSARCFPPLPWSWTLRGLPSPGRPGSG